MALKPIESGNEPMALKPIESGNEPVALSQMNSNEPGGIEANELISTPIGGKRASQHTCLWQRMNKHTAHPSVAFGLASTHVCGGE